MNFRITSLIVFCILPLIFLISCKENLTPEETQQLSTQFINNCDFIEFHLNKSHLAFSGRDIDLALAEWNKNQALIEEAIQDNFLIAAELNSRPFIDFSNYLLTMTAQLNRKCRAITAQTERRNKHLLMETSFTPTIRQYRLNLDKLMSHYIRLIQNADRKGSRFTSLT